MTQDATSSGFAARGSSSSTTSRWLNLALFTLVAGAFLLWAADRDGYEGDDLNSVVPMFHLDAALRDELLIYRYAWQPLSYQLGALIIKLTASPELVFLLAPLAATTSLALLISITQRTTRRRFPFIVYPSFLVLIPELWASGLYFNSTILGLPFLIGSWHLLLRPDASSKRTIAAGVLVALAMLFRLDFVLATPLLAYFSWQNTRSLRFPLLLALSVVSVLGLAVAVGVVDLQAILDVHRASSAEMQARAAQPGWDLRAKLQVATTALHPFAILLLSLGLLPVVLSHWKKSRKDVFLIACATLPLLYPATGLLSVKYLLPLFAFLPPLLADCFAQLQERYLKRTAPRAPLFIIAAALSALAVSVEPDKAAPYFRVTATRARVIPTHDGPRTWGAYLSQFLRVDRLSAPTPEQTASRELIELLDDLPAGSDLIVYGGENFFDLGGIAWRHTQLAAQKRRFFGELIAPHVIRLPWKKSRLWLSNDLESALSHLTETQGRQSIQLDLSTPNDPAAVIEEIKLLQVRPASH